MASTSPSVCCRFVDGEPEVLVRALDLEILEELGRGAYGVVEKMRHRETGTIMAVKVLTCFADLSLRSVYS